jgi:hypothetical protein
MNAVSVTLGEVWSYDDKTKEYSEISGATAASVIATKANSGTTCTCSNYLSEIEYIVTLELKDATDSADATLKKSYQPSGIKANVVLGSNAASGTCGKKTGVRQSFKISFNTNTDVQKIIQKNSGNPGYLDGYPLKIGF